MNNDRDKKKYGYFVWIVTFLVLVVLSSLTYKINCLPDDSCISYVPTAAKVFDLRYPSQMHDLLADSLSHLNMRSKEAFVVGIALMQRLWQDSASPFPNIFLVIMAVGGSAILLYYIFSQLFDRLTGLFAFVLWATTFWPYQYALLGAHQPVVLFNFLLTVYLLLVAKRRWVFYVGAGVTGGLMFFSSPTAIIYIPYFLVLFLQKPEKGAAVGKRAGRAFAQGGLFLAGMGLTILFFVLPHPREGFRLFLHYLLTSQGANHFRHYHAYLSEIFPLAFAFRGAGWLWIGKYFLLIMPVLFPAYGLALLYLLKKSFRQRFLLAVILVSLSTPLAVETAQVAQFGRNYFSWLPGIIFILAYVFFEERTRRQRKFFPRWRKKMGTAGLALVLLAHIVFNGFVFWTDIFPSRMGTAWVREWLDAQQVQEVLVYAQHPRNLQTVDVLNNPKFGKPIKFYGIDRLAHVDRGYVLIPPVRGQTIFYNCVDEPFVSDPILEKLLKTGAIEKYAVFSAPTLATSRIWAQEEEVCSYLDLMFEQIQGYHKPESRFYILDIGKLRQDGWLPGLSAQSASGKKK